MRPDGRADNALEQLLWAYALGATRHDDDKTAGAVALTASEVNRMFDATCGVKPARADLEKWLKSVNQFLRASRHD